MSRTRIEIDPELHEILISIGLDGESINDTIWRIVDDSGYTELMMDIHE